MRPAAVVGELTIDYEALTLPADPDQTLFIYTARPGASQEAMRLLASWSLDAPARTDRIDTDGPATPSSPAADMPPTKAVAPDDTAQETP